MGRYPFMEKANEYMDSRRGCIADSTWTTQLRRYNRMFRELMDLHSQGKVSSLAPAKMTPDDVKAFIVYRKSLDISFSNISHDITALDQLLLYCGNVAVQNCFRANPGLKPVNKTNRHPPLSEDTYRLILDRYETVDHSDIHEVRAYALVLMSITLGTRNKELRLADLRDLDTAEWLLFINHVKGEDTYGSKRVVPVPPEVRPVIQDYLLLRSQWLIDHKMKSDALFCPLIGNSDHLSGNSFRRIKAKIEEDIGKKFELRDCRRAFGQMYVNKGTDIEVVSVLMGHNTTKTTETYYCRLDVYDAVREAKKKW